MNKFIFSISCFVMLAVLTFSSCEKQPKSVDLDVNSESVVGNDKFTVWSLFRRGGYNMSSVIDFNEDGELQISLGDKDFYYGLNMDMLPELRVNESCAQTATIPIPSPNEDGSVSVPFSFEAPWSLVGEKVPKEYSSIDTLRIYEGVKLYFGLTESSPFRSANVSSLVITYPSDVTLYHCDIYDIVDGHSIAFGGRQVSKNKSMSSEFLNIGKKISVGGENLSPSFRKESVIKISGVLKLNETNLDGGCSWPNEVQLYYSHNLTTQVDRTIGRFDIRNEYELQHRYPMTIQRLNDELYFLSAKDSRIKLYDTSFQLEFTNNTPYPAYISGKIESFGGDGTSINSFKFGDETTGKVLAKPQGSGNLVANNVRKIQLSEYGRYPDVDSDKVKDERYGSIKVPGLSDILNGNPYELRVTSYFTFDKDKTVELRSSKYQYLSNMYMRMPLRFGDGFWLTRDMVIQIDKAAFPDAKTSFENIDLEMTIENTTPFHIEVTKNSAFEYGNQQKPFQNDNLVVKDGSENSSCGTVTIHLDYNEHMNPIIVPIHMFVDKTNEGKPVRRDQRIRVTSLKMIVK